MGKQGWRPLVLVPCVLLLSGVMGAPSGLLRSGATGQAQGQQRALWVEQVHFGTPRSNGYVISACVEQSGDCGGKAAADLFCNTQGCHCSSGFSLYEGNGSPLYQLGDNSVSKAKHKQGLAAVTCECPSAPSSSAPRMVPVQQTRMVPPQESGPRMVPPQDNGPQMVPVQQNGY